MDSPNHSRATPKTGFLAVAGITQIVLGSFYLLISVLGSVSLMAVGYEWSALLGQAFYSHEWTANPTPLHIRNAIEAFMIFQVLIGWILGPLTIWAGIRSRRAESRKLILWTAAANLLYFPIGTTIGAVALIELNREEVKYRFSDYRLPHETAVR